MNTKSTVQMHKFHFSLEKVSFEIKKILIRDSVILLFCLAYFLFSWTMAILWDNKGYYHPWDVLFDTDPWPILKTYMSIGGLKAISHAFLEVIALPVVLLAKTFTMTGLFSDEIFSRKIIAMAISPLFSTATIYIFYNTLKFFRIRSIEIIIFTLIFAFSFSNLLFSIVPETYAISCFFISLLIYYYFYLREIGKQEIPILWILLAISLTGITITNISIFFVIFTLHLIKNKNLPIFRALIKSSGFSALILAFVIGIFKGTYFVLGMQQGFTGGKDYILIFITKSVSQSMNFISNLFVASLNSLGAFSPSSYFDKQYNRNMMTFSVGTEDNVLVLLVVVIFVSIIILSWKQFKKPQWNDLYLISLLIFSFNFVLHSIFGKEMFLYSQHWIIPLIFIFIPILNKKRYLSIPFLIMLIGVNLHFLFTIGNYLD